DPERGRLPAAPPQGALQPGRRPGAAVPAGLRAGQAVGHAPGGGRVVAAGPGGAGAGAAVEAGVLGRQGLGALPANAHPQVADALAGPRRDPAPAAAAGPLATWPQLASPRVDNPEKEKGGVARWRLPPTVRMSRRYGVRVPRAVAARPGPARAGGSGPG